MDSDKNNENSPKKKSLTVTIVIVCCIVLFIGFVIALVELDGSNTSKIKITNAKLLTEYSEYLGYSAKITGTAENTSGKNYSYVAIEYSVYDAGGNNLGTAIANINNLASGDTWNFEAVLLSFPSSKPCSFKLVEITYM